jgi:outer membrane receptor for ferric coprogen and ferric-rhodotorulic acid
MPKPFTRSRLNIHLQLALFSAGALALTAVHGAEPVQSAVSVSASRQYDIPAGPLVEVLSRFASVSGVGLSFDGAQLAGKSCPGLKGSYNIEAGFASLLAGTGLRASMMGQGYVLEPAPNGAGAVELGATSVDSTAIRDSVVTEGSHSYTQTGPSTTATGLGLTLRETPQSLTVITRQKMDDFNSQTLKDVMKQAPGISVSYLADSVTFFARGTEINNYQTDGSRSAGTASALGAPINTGLVFDDMADMDRVEVLKGATGLLRGDGNPSATVNLVRKQPTREFQAHLGAGAGSWDTYRSDVDVSGPLTESGNVRGRAVAAYKDANSYKDNVQNRNALLYGTVDFDLTPETLLNIGVDYKERQTRGNSNSTGARAYDQSGNYQGKTSRSWNAGAPWSGYDQKSVTFLTTLEHRFDNGWEAKLHVNIEKSEIPEWKNATVNQPGNTPSLSKYTGAESLTKGLNFDVKGEFELLGRSHELLLGADYMRNDSRMNRWRAPLDYRQTTLPAYAGLNAIAQNYLSEGGNLFPKPEGDWVPRDEFRGDTSRTGAYLATRLHLADDLKAILGVRTSTYKYNYSDLNLEDGDIYIINETHQKETGVVTPYAGLVYDLNRNLSVYASYADIFQPVTVQDAQGQLLDPKKGITYEIGSKAEFYDGRLNASVAYFWKRWDNAYESTGGRTPAGDTAYRNVTGVMEHGYELELSGELLPGLQAQGSYVMNNSELDDSYYGLPRQQFKFDTTYQLPGALANLTLGASTRWQSKISTSTDYNTLEQKAYWVTDAMARYRFNQHLSANVNVNNVFDKKYYSGVNTFDFGEGLYYTWGEPRNLNVSVRYDF